VFVFSGVAFTIRVGGKVVVVPRLRLDALAISASGVLKKSVKIVVVYDYLNLVV